MVNYLIISDLKVSKKALRDQKNAQSSLNSENEIKKKTSYLVFKYLKFFKLSIILIKLGFDGIFLRILLKLY